MDFIKRIAIPCMWVGGSVLFPCPGQIWNCVCRWGRDSDTLNRKIFWISQNIQIFTFPNGEERGWGKVWCKHKFSWRFFIPSQNIQNVTFLDGGVLVLAMVTFSKSPKASKSSLSPLGGYYKTSKSSLTLMGGGVLLLAMVKQNNELHNKYIVVLVVVKFSKSLKSSKSSLPLMGGEGFWYLLW